MVQAAWGRLGVAWPLWRVGRLLTKLDTRDRTQLVIAVYESGLADR